MVNRKKGREGRVNTYRKAVRPFDRLRACR
jgi:hypothetical protein